MPDAPNPFASEFTERLAFRFSGANTWESLLARLVAQNYIGAIVGGRGSGKTVLIEQLQPHLVTMGFEPVMFRLSSESSLREKERLSEALRAVTKPGFILIDGAEQLSTRLWLPMRAAAGRAAGLVVTVHRVSRLPTLIECETSPERLRELVQELTGETISADDAESIVLRHRGNLRDCLRELYVWWEEQSAAEESGTAGA